MTKKYRLTDVKRIVDGHLLYRIEAIKNFGCILKGECGGYIESEDNLSHEGICWVYDKACVYDDARIDGGSRVCDIARVFGNARVREYARVYGSSWVFGNAHLHGGSHVIDNSIISDRAEISGYVGVFGNSRISGNSILRGQFYLHDNSNISGTAIVELSDHHYALKVSADHGYWNQLRFINDKIYLISKTLEKLEVLEKRYG